MRNRGNKMTNEDRDVLQRIVILLETLQEAFEELEKYLELENIENAQIIISDIASAVNSIREGLKVSLPEEELMSLQMYEDNFDDEFNFFSTVVEDMDNMEFMSEKLATGLKPVFDKWRAEITSVSKKYIDN